MSQDRMMFPFMSPELKQAGLSPTEMGCTTHCLRDVLLFHDVQNIRHMLVQPLSIVFVGNKDRDVWLLSLAEVRPQQFRQGLRGSWQVTFGYQESIAYIRTCQEEGKIAIFRTNWSKVPYSPIYGRRNADGHNGLAIAYLQETDQLYIADRSHGLGPKNDPRFVDNRGYIPAEEMLPAFNDFFSYLHYELNEPERSWEDELKLLIKESVEHMNSREGWMRAHQEFGFRALTHLAWFIQRLDSHEVASSTQLQYLLRGLMPRNIHLCILGNHKLFFAVLNESYPLEELGIDVLASRTQQSWYRLALALTNLGREFSEANRQRCLEQISQIIEFEQYLIEHLQSLIS